MPRPFSAPEAKSPISHIRGGSMPDVKLTDAEKQDRARELAMTLESIIDLEDEKKIHYSRLQRTA
jgi:hypothetical protein